MSTTKLVAIRNSNIEVFFRDPNSNQGPFEVGQVAQCEAEEDEFPESWNMPEGFVFVELTA